MRLSLTLSLLLVMALHSHVFGIVKYDEGREIIMGIQLLQDRDDPTAYYYIPQYPRVAQNETGDLEILCMKYVGNDDLPNGGIFHALIEFTLPDEVLIQLQDSLRLQVSSEARVVGPVPMLQTAKDGEEGLASFSVISSTLQAGADSIGNKLITSGHAPLLPGSKAAIAARLSQAEATLLWESFQGTTSDVSVSVSGYYEAAVKGYKAVINAEMSNIYKHYSRILNRQEGYNKAQIRRITDEFARSGGLETDVFTRGSVDAKEMDNLLNLVTSKLIDIMFDTKTGWSKMPEKHTVNENTFPGRQPRGFFNKIFSGAKNDPYISDDQFVLKNIKEIRTNRFYLNLNKSTTIKVPIHTSGNIGGTFYETHKDKYFRIVNLDDPDFQKRDIQFQIDGEYAETFGDIFNSVSVTFKKKYQGDHNDVTKELVFYPADVNNSNGVKAIAYARLGEDESWFNYDYQINWNPVSTKGTGKSIRIPSDKEKWLLSNDVAISLIPPFKKKKIEVEIEPSIFEKDLATTAEVRFYVIFQGKAKPQKSVFFRQRGISTEEDVAENTKKLAIFFDETVNGGEEPCYYQVIWHGSQFEDGKKVEKAIQLDTGNQVYIWVSEPK